ncbi:hypothetical protein QBC43DRAFT_320076 [Cladorrhinum sp. PSN259]|nr:hypothetical protein QBC43DRAFT_320076 [Cladorrhinum sp. PSN259]
MDDDFSERWERHISALRNEFSTSSVRALTSGSRSPNGEEPEGTYPSKGWNDQYNSVVDILDDLALQSPNTIITTTNTTSQSPRTPWFTDTETALSSPEEATTSWPRFSHSQPCSSPSYTTSKPAPTASTPTQPKPRSLLFPPLKNPTQAITPQTTIHSPFYIPQPPPPTSVSCLLLSWAPPNTRLGSDGQLLSPSLPSDTDSLRNTLKKRGYKVQCRVIPSDYPTSAVEGFVDRFLYHQQSGGGGGHGSLPKNGGSGGSSSGELMIIYYRGFGWTDGEGRLVFSSGEQTAGSQFYWDDIQTPIMQHPSDVLMIFDCTALPHTQQEIRLGGNSTSTFSISPKGTKQVLGVCVPSFPGGSFTQQQQRRHYSDYHDDDYGTMQKPNDTLTRSLCNILSFFSQNDFQPKEEEQEENREVLSLQRLCSLIRQDIRSHSQLENNNNSSEALASRVFVTQLGGGQLLDIYLPILPAIFGSNRFSSSFGGGVGGRVDEMMR